MQTEAEILSFMRDAGWADATRHKLASDFSTRRFFRLTRTHGDIRSAVLMCADRDQKTDSFVDFASILRRIKLPAPKIYASDIIRSLVLMEDFGDSTVGSLINGNQNRQKHDERAAQILAKLHQSFSQSMLGASRSPLYNAALFTEQTTVFLDDYFPLLFRRAATPKERSIFVEAWHEVLSPLDLLPRSLVLRDFMPDNMMVLPAPVHGWDVGLLDFQDAGLGCIAYDVASWCEEVRRDGGLARLPAFVDIYCALRPEVSAPELLRAARVYSAQRHTRILGRLAVLGKMDLVPRVWRVVQALLKEEEALAPVRRWFLLCRPQT